MIRSVAAVSSLLSGMGVLLVGSGLLGLIVALRGASAGFSDLTIGWLMSGFYVGYILGASVCPRVIEQAGHIRAFTAFAACSAALALAYGLFEHPVVWWLLRVASGLCLIGLYMVIESWLNVRAVDHRGQVFAVYMMVNLVAVALGQAMITAYGAEHANSLAIAAILFCLGLVPIALTQVSQPEVPKTDRLSLATVYRLAPVGAAGAVFSGLISGSFWSLGPVFARGFGWDDGEVALFIVTTVAGGAIMQWPLGWLSDRYDRRSVLLAVSVGLVASVGGIGVVPAQSIGTLLGFAFLFGGFSFTLYSLAVAQTHDRFQSKDALEATKSLLLMHGIGAAAGPLLTGAVMTVAERGFAIALATLGATLAVFTAARLLLDAPVPLEDKSHFALVEQTSVVAMELDPRTPVHEEDASDRSPAGFDLAADATARAERDVDIVAPEADTRTGLQGA